ncbi:unnamed protein product [Effrenium voratum]|uniref:ATP-dependent DNA helicase n=1 Tax=Effrenium voratum TaxID=2562239 RepID=A0AA36I4W0_9DINO|nr:unnamed protein product [Effrenium voratum]CAJ1432979.1 unnamed protein product [Effrenium voratum]
MATGKSPVEAATEGLQRHFGHEALRPFQVQAIEAWSQGQDAIVTLSTGAGKSVCFQLPPLIDGRCTLVISPLVSLMQDQVRTLRQRQIPAALFGSGAHDARLSDLAGMYRVAYMCPEFAMSRISELAQLRESICLLAIDEAHCISSWGHEFRPQYKQLGQLRQVLGKPPTMAITATCTAAVREDIRRCLQLINPTEVLGPTNRPNLQLLIRRRTTLEDDLKDTFGLNASRDGIDNTSISSTSSSIVYVPTKARSEEVANWLQSHGVKAAAYHAGLSMQARQERHTAFMLDELQVIVATVAFGMGIDKPSIRRVIHYGGVRSIEHYVQQCGRAGRDGEDAECIAFVRPQDFQETRAHILQDFSRNPDEEYCKRLLALHGELVAFLSDSSQCRRVRLLQHFGDLPGSVPHGQPPRGECILVDGKPCCQWCDVCLLGACKLQQQEGDFTRECQVFLRCVDACGGMTGSTLPCALAAGQNIDRLRAKKLHLHKTFGSGDFRPLAWWKAFVPHLLQAGLLQERPSLLASGRSYAALCLTAAGKAVLQKVSSFKLCPVPHDLAGAGTADALSKVSKAQVEVRSTGLPAKIEASLSAVDCQMQELYRRLSHVRQQWMRRLNIMGEAIISNPILRSLAKIRPASVLAAQHYVPGLPSLMNKDISDLLQALVEEVNKACKEFALPQNVNTQAQKRAGEDLVSPMKKRSEVNPQKPSCRAEEGLLLNIVLTNRGRIRCHPVRQCLLRPLCSAMNLNVQLWRRALTNGWRCWKCRACQMADEFPKPRS